MFGWNRKGRGDGEFIAIKGDSFQSVREVQIDTNIEFVSEDVTTKSNLHISIHSC